MKEVEHDMQFQPKEEIEVHDFDAYSFVTLARIYDLLAVIARAISPHEAKMVLDAHEEGSLIGAPPGLGEEA